MNQIIKTNLNFILAVISLFVMAGCGGGSGGSDSDSNNNSNNTTPTGPVYEHLDWAGASSDITVPVTMLVGEAKYYSFYYSGSEVAPQFSILNITGEVTMYACEVSECGKDYPANLVSQKATTSVLNTNYPIPLPSQPTNIYTVFENTGSVDESFNFRIYEP